MSCDALTISKRFALEGEPVDAKPYGCGHINDTSVSYTHLTLPTILLV